MWLMGQRLSLWGKNITLFSVTVTMMYSRVTKASNIRGNSNLNVIANIDSSARHWFSIFLQYG